MSGCLSSVGNEEGVLSQPFSVTASSPLDGSYRPGNSSLYSSLSWCSSPAAFSPQYLQFNFGKVVTVSGIATQGDAVDEKWVTKYAVSYGYDEQSWLDYAEGQVKVIEKTTGTVDKLNQTSRTSFNNNKYYILNSSPIDELGGGAYESGWWC